jgi:hypothetical protein
VGIESRDWYRDGRKKKRRKRPSWLLPWLIGTLILSTALFAASPVGRWALGLDKTSVSGEHATHQDLKMSLLPGTPAITIHKAAL